MIMHVQCVFNSINVSNADYNNEFLEITRAQTSFAAIATAEGALVVDGRRVTVAKVMVYKNSWLTTNFRSPMLQALSLISDRTTLRRANTRSAAITAQPRSATVFSSASNTTSVNYDRRSM